ncbi:MAG: acyl-[ACP]--phospholipid O-acyltransferase [Rickettsiaceae bacterium]|nr:acyl-[ACP]--phospholipid O-acyltransferase [Rickettsiaceae bacterium]
MESNQFSLFKDRRFLPIFIVQFCGCLNDSILKNALIILVTFKLANELPLPPYTLVMLANVLFILPFVFLASIAGQIADRYERSTIVKIIKFIEISIVMMSAYGFYHTDLVILFSCIALMGIHSTFFGPIKYSVLPDHLKKNELLSANGLIEAGTFMSILIGTMLGGCYNFSGSFVIVLALLISLIGFAASLFMPKSNNSNPDIKINLNIIEETISIVKYSASKNQVYLSILGISWFWFIGAAIMAQIPSLTRDILGADETVANLFLAVFSIGVGVGSFLCSKILNNTITTKYVFLASMGLSLFGIDLFFASKIASINYEPEQLKNMFQFLSRGHYIRILFDLFAFAAFGGLYVVPLFAVMQYFTSPAYRSRVIAANNLINSFFMAGSTIILSLLFYMNFSIPSVILIVSILNAIVGVYIYKIIPNSKIIPMKLWRAIFRQFFKLLYKVEVKGLENYKKAGKRTVIIANHLSYIDPALIASYIPENIQFAINAGVAQEWWVKPFLKIVRTFPIESNNPMALKSLIEEVKQDKKIAIFPEGRTSLTGSLMKIYEGPGMIADKADATILPIRVDGTQFTRFSKVRKLMSGKFVFRRKIVITILPPVKVTPPENLDNRERRKFIGHALYDLMSDMMFESSDYKETVFQSLIDSSKIYGKKSPIMQDVDNNKENYNGLLLKSFILANLVQRDSKAGEKVGLMLPNMVASAVTFFGLQAAGRVPAMINFTSGSSNVVSSCRTARIHIIYTSKKFVKKAELGELVDSLEKSGITLIYLEDLRKHVTYGMKIKCFLGTFFPQKYYEHLCDKRDDLETAVILFTSGTEGRPKAVALSHRNLQANRCQVISRIDFNPYDCAFNALPMFHSFGLMATLIMSLSGVRTFYYPSPLHYRIIPEIIYDIGATVMFGTDTFLAGYAANAHPYDFYSLRYVIAGAEKAKVKTKQTWFEKFGIKIFEAYGVTEAAPGIAVSTPMHNKPGTVGRLLPKIEYVLQPVEGISEGGRLCIRGPNIMQGYIKPENPGVIETVHVDKLGDHWYDTGDIVSIDEDGYMTIIGRQKRFAKVAGEMVSLSAVEDLISKSDASSTHAAVCIEDEKKGEQIVLFTTSTDMTRDKIAKSCHELQIAELYIPKTIIAIKELPVLATGKLNYRKLVEMAEKD